MFSLDSHPHAETNGNAGSEVNSQTTMNLMTGFQNLIENHLYLHAFLDHDLTVPPWVEPYFGLEIYHKRSRF